MTVLRSDLKAYLKPLAVVCALHGDDAGRNIFPSVGRLAWELGTTGRTVQRQLQVLRRRRILIAETPLTGGAYQTVRYRLDASSLPQRPTWEPRHQRQGSCPKNHDAHVARTTTSETETTTPKSRNHDTGVVRSVSDPSEDSDLKKSTGDFDAFWQAYPRKVGKDAALKAWRKRRPDRALLDAMLRALDWQRNSPQWRKDDGQYVPYPSTWLNQGRWQDEPPHGVRAVMRECPHTPRCENPGNWQCQQRTQLDAAKKGVA
jgi:hypothetical protein